jgi:NTP pyrophosphatase (non-canonical NTP hydrolase)
MDLNTYGKQAMETMLGTHDFGEISPSLLSCVLGLVGESGEVAEKFKKLIRDKSGVISDEDKAELLKELGDILWYVNAVAERMGSSLEEVAAKNIEKIMSRKARGVSRGNGDNR